MTENIDYSDGDLTPLIEGDNGFRYDEDYSEAGYRETSVEEEESFFDTFEEDVELSDEDIEEEFDEE